MKELTPIERAKEDARGKTSKIEGAIKILEAIEESRKTTPQLSIIEELRQNLDNISFEESPLSKKDRQAMLEIDDFLIRALTVSKVPLGSEMINLLIKYCADDFDKSRKMTMNSELINLTNKGIIDLNLDRTFSLHEVTHG